LVAGWRIDELCEATVQVGVVLRPHVAAAAPVLVADAEIRKTPGFFTSVFAAELRKARIRVGGDVLHPLCHLPWTAGADVAGNVGVRADQFHEVEELVRAELVRLFHSAPGC